MKNKTDQAMVNAIHRQRHKFKTTKLLADKLLELEKLKQMEADRRTRGCEGG